MKKILLAALLSLLCAPSAFSANQRGPFQLVEQPGKPVLFKFVDGREAQAVVDYKPPYSVGLPFQVTDNLCSSVVNTKCKYFTSVGLNTFSMQWTRHPDATKIGKPVVMKPKGGVTTTMIPLTNQMFYAVSDRLTSPKIAGHLANDELSCPDYGWLPQVKPVGEGYDLARWDIEGMFENPETGLMENRTIGVQLGVHLQPKPSGNLELNRVQKYFGASSNLFGATLWALIVKRGEGDFCAVTLKPDITSVTNDFITYVSQPPHYIPYLFGSDEFSTTLRPFFLNENFLGNTYDLE